MAIVLDAALEKRAASLYERAVIVDAFDGVLVERPSAIVDGKDQVDGAVEAGFTASNQPPVLECLASIQDGPSPLICQGGA